MNSRQWSARLGLLLLAAVVGLCVFQTSSSGVKESPDGSRVVSPLSSRQHSLWGGEAQNALSRESRRRMLSSSEDDGDVEYYYYYYDDAQTSLYGLYGFYGATAPSSVNCDLLSIKFTLYNFGARDLTHVSTIQFIIDKTKEAIDLTYIEAVPTGSASNYETTVTELDGSAVTYVTVTAEVNFQAGNLSPRAAREAGGVLATYLGYTQADAGDHRRQLLQNGGYDAPSTPSSVGMDVLVSGYTSAQLEDELEMAAFLSTLQSSFQTAILAVSGDSSAAASATVQVVGIADAEDNMLAVLMTLKYSEAIGKEFEEKLEKNDSSLAWGPLAGKVMISNMAPSTADVVDENIVDHRHRHLLYAERLSQNLDDVGLGGNSVQPHSFECRVEWTSEGDDDSFYGMGTDNVYFSILSKSNPTEEEIFSFVEDLVKDLGISSSPEVSILTLGQKTEVLASFNNDPTGAAKLAAALRGKDNVEVGSSATAGSSADGTGSSAEGASSGFAATSADGSSSGFYGFYGSSSSFYGFYGSSSQSSSSAITSAAGSFAASSGAVGSSGGYVGSDGYYVGSSGGYVVGSSHIPGSVIGPYSSAAPSSGAVPKPGGVLGPKSSATPPGAVTSSSGHYYPGGSSSAGMGGGSDSSNAGGAGYHPGGSSSAGDLIIPVSFTGVVSKYNIEDLSAEAMSKFKSDYINVVASAIKHLGITSNPSVVIKNVGPADSVAVETTVTFRNDPAGAKKFMDYLPLDFPDSSLGPISVVDVSGGEPIGEIGSSGYYVMGSSGGAAIGSSGGAAIGSSGGAAIGSGGSGIGSSGAALGSSGTGVGSSSGFVGSDGVFYGYKVPSKPSSPSASPSDSSSGVGPKPPGPKPPGPKPTPPSPKPPTPPSQDITPVYFTTILSDYNMEDLYTDEDMAQFRSDYVAAVDSAIKLLGITSNPAVTIQNVVPASVAVPSVVTFVDDPSGAQLFMEVLASNPSLAFPAFSGLGTITIVDVSTEPGSSGGFQSGSNPGPIRPETSGGSDTDSEQTCPISRAGESCCGPATLDAQNDCCWKGVDECGVCAGNSDTCATTATVRVLVTRPGVTTDVNSPAFADMEEDFKAGIANLFNAFNIKADNIVVDTSSVTAQQTSGGLEFDIPFRINPDVDANVAAPTLTKARAILVAAAEQKTEADGMTIIGVLNVARAGVCGNGKCEIGEFFHHVSHNPVSTCAADCPDFKSCPAVSGKVCGGAGQCATDSGSCICSKGWDGPACTKCADGYTKVNGLCSTSVEPREAPTTSSDSGSSNARDIILGVVFGIVALVLIGLLCYYLFVIRKRNEASREEGLAFSSQQQVPASNEEPDIPTRQLTENTV
mmetsp:Transcript_31010/g.87838  ORF Transcript_31010/g.87838 Transcript_31010/m.87838 type:complete len:1345 (-) Transcript_31010:247-4281(-)